MHTSGLLLVFDENQPKVLETLSRISDDVCLTFGERSGNTISAALECDNAEAAEAWHRTVVELPGVLGVEVVFVHWSEPAEGAFDGRN